MLGSGTLAALGLLLFVSVLAREPALFLLALTLLVAHGLSRLWEENCLKRIEYRRHLSQTRAAFGDQVELEVEIVNRKLLPLAWLEAEDEVPRDLPPARVRTFASHKSGRVILPSLLAFRPYERVRRRYTLTCNVRGEHVFGPTRLRSGDLFGFVTREQHLDQTDSLVVYPRVLSLTDLGLPARQPLGNIRVQSWLFEDATRVAGAREYRPGDGPRRIHWAATARTQRLQSKVFEATTSHQISIFLNLAASDDVWWSQGYDPDVLEMTITTAASLASWGLEQGYQVGLATNGMHRWSWGDVGVRPGSDPGQIERILLALGRLQPFAVRRFAELLAEEARRLAFGTTVVLVTSALGEAAAAEALALRARGHAVTVILTGRSAAAPRLGGIAVRHVGPPEAWREAKELSLAGSNYNERWGNL